MKRVLCLSGGGVMGIAQIEVLKALEVRYGKPLSEVYDLIIGTSVGAILGAYISTNSISMTTLSNTFNDMSKYIFKRKFLKIPKYDRNRFVDIWDTHHKGLKFGEASTKLMITTVDSVRNRNIYYKSWEPEYSDYNMCTLVLRSFAAPYYFGALPDHVEGKVFIDGGCGSANLPILEAKLQSEVFGWYHNGESVEIHAIGSLFSQDDSSYHNVANNGVVSQFLSFLNPTNGGLARLQSREDQLRVMKYVCSKFPNIKFRYWDSIADRKKLRIDGVKHIEYYKSLGSNMAISPLISYN